MTYQFVPESFKAPFQVENKEFVLRKLTVDEVEKDYAAVMSSKESLRQIFCENDDWPSDDMTIEENYRDLLEHQEEFDKNEGFAYTIVTPDDTKCIGCLYIYPFPYGRYDSRVYYWLVDDENERLSGVLHDFVDQWIPEVFGLERLIYPGRSIDHQSFKDLVAELKAHNG